MCLLTSCLFYHKVRLPSCPHCVGLCLNPTSAGELMVFMINRFCFLTFTGGDLITPCAILPTLDLECVHFHITLGRSMKEMWGERREVGLVVVSQYKQLKQQTWVS